MAGGQDIYRVAEKGFRVGKKDDRMNMIFRFGLLALLLAGCARIPAGSVLLTDALMAEGERMHTLNLALVNRLFNEKKTAIDKFINAEYTPAVAARFIAKISTDDFRKDFPEMVQALTPEINARRDSLVKVLDQQREKTVDKLNADYKAFASGFAELKGLLESAVKIDKEKSALFEKVKALAANRIDLTRLENALDRFVNSAGKTAGGIVDVNNDINQILSNK